MNERDQQLLFSLLHDLHRQFHVGTFTVSPCEKCGEPCRGGLCADCIAENIATMTGDRNGVDRYVDALERQQMLIRKWINVEDT